MSQTDSDPLAPRAIDVQFEDISQLPVHYVNLVNVSIAQDAFFFTLGVVFPPTIRTPDDLAQINTLNGTPLFRCAVTPVVMEQLVNLLQNQLTLYKQSVEQANALAEPHGKEDEGNA